MPEGKHPMSDDIKVEFSEEYHEFIGIYDNALPSEVCKDFLTLIDNAPKKRITDKGEKDVWYVHNTCL